MFTGEFIQEFLQSVDGIHTLRFDIQINGARQHIAATGNILFCRSYAVDGIGRNYVIIFLPQTTPK